MTIREFRICRTCSKKFKTKRTGNRVNCSSDCSKFYDSYKQKKIRAMMN